MGTKMIRVDEDLYDELSARKREDETWSETIERLIEGPSLLSLAGILSDDQADDFREAIEDADASAEEDIDDLVERFENTE